MAGHCCHRSISILLALAPWVVLAVTSRGVRLCNPGNIRYGAAWLGLAKQQPDADFCTFIAPEYGIRAMMVIFGTYAKRGLKTVQAIITAWAPVTENDTAAYIAAVRKAIGKDSVTPKDYIPLCKAIIKHENGSQPYPDSVFSEAQRLLTTRA